MRKALLLTLLFSTLLCTRGRAQLDVPFETGADADLTNAEKAFLSSTVSSRLADYESLLGSLIDDTGRLDQEKAAQFSALFIANNERVVNDLVEDPTQTTIGLPTYLSLVERYFLVDGLAFELNSARIVQVQADEDKRLFQVDVSVNKSAENFYVPDGQVEEGELSRVLIFSYRIPAGDPAAARLKSIALPAAELTAEYVRYAGAYMGYGAGIKIEQKPGNVPDGFSGEQGADLSFGISLLTNSFLPASNEKKNLFLAAGLGIYGRTSKGELTMFDAGSGGGDEFSVRTATNDPVTGVEIQRSGTNIEATEEQRAIGLRLSLGPAFRIYDKKGISAFVSVQYAPSIPLAITGEIEGSGNYNITGNGRNLNFNTDLINTSQSFKNDFSVGTGEIDGSPDLDAKIVHGLLLSASFMKDLAEGSSVFGIGLSLEHYLPLTVAWANVEDDAASSTPFLTNGVEDTRVGPLGLYTEDVKLGYTGIKLRVYLKSYRIAGL